MVMFKSGDLVNLRPESDGAYSRREQLVNVNCFSMCSGDLGLCLVVGDTDCHGRQDILLMNKDGEIGWFYSMCLNVLT